MKYDHAVIYNGKFYAAGSEVPEPVKEVKKEEKVETKKASTSKRK